MSTYITVNDHQVPDSTYQLIEIEAEMTLKVVSSEPISSVRWHCVGQYPADIVVPSMTYSGTPNGESMTYTHPIGELGVAFLWEAIINEYVDGNINPDAKTVRTVIKSESTEVSGFYPLCTNETNELSSECGWVDQYNKNALSFGGFLQSDLDDILANGNSSTRTISVPTIAVSTISNSSAINVTSGGSIAFSSSGGVSYSSGGTFYWNGGTFEIESSGNFTLDCDLVELTGSNGIKLNGVQFDSQTPVSTTLSTIAKTAIYTITPEAGKSSLYQIRITGKNASNGDHYQALHRACVSISSDGVELVTNKDLENGDYSSSVEIDGSSVKVYVEGPSTSYDWRVRCSTNVEDY